MIWILLIISFVVYIVLTWTIIYHLQTYTINKELARRAIIIFIAVTILLICAQFLFFIFVEQQTEAVINTVRTDAFGSPF